MENPLRKQIRSIMKDHKKRQMWYRIVTTLAVVVVFVTTYMLILPAITMENKAECGITEHKHDANCYSSHYEKEKELACTTDSLGVHKHTDACYDAEHKLICGYADFVIHEHDASCYDKDGNLVCTIPEHKLHQHTPECYQMQKQLVCTQEESVGHTHTPECYTKQQGELICGKEEHTHGEGCYDAEGNLICTLEEHTHSDECYEWNDVLTCTIPESAGHTHSEVCYQDVQVLICEEPAELHTHTAECYKDGVLACGKLELKEHKHSETCFTEKQVLVETLICDRVEHVHTDECYKGSGQKEEQSSVASEEVTRGQSEEVTSEDASTEENSTEEISSEELSTEEVSTEEVSLEETSTEEASSQIEEGSSEETSLEASSEDETEVESETESAEEVESESEIESESESETEESSSIEAETEEESSEEVSTEEESSEEESFEETSTEETSEEELTSEEASTEEGTSEAEEESSELPQLTGFWPMDMMEVAHALVGSTKHDLVKFCLDYIGISDMGYDSDLTTWIDNLTELNLYSSREDLIPSPGDVIFFDNDGDGIADHVGIITDVAENEEDVQELITVVQSNHDGLVEEQEYQTDDERIVGQGSIIQNDYPNYAPIQNGTMTLENDVNLADYITSIVMQKKNGNNYQNVDQFQDGDQVRVALEYKVENGKVTSENRTLVYQLPKGVRPNQSLSGKITGEINGKKYTDLGDYVISADGKISITFNDTFFTTHGAFTGGIEFEGMASLDGSTESQKVQFKADGKTYTINPKPKNADLTIKKTRSDPKNGKITYTVTASSKNGTDSDQVKIVDRLTYSGLEKVTVGKPTVKKGNTEILYNNSDYEIKSGTGFSEYTLKLPALGAGESYTVSYEVDYGKVVGNGYASISNKADGYKGDTWKSSDQTNNVEISKEMIKKYGSATDNNRAINWTIEINPNHVVDFEGEFAIKDSLNYKEIDLTKAEDFKVTETDMGNNWQQKDVTNTAFKDGKLKVRKNCKYTITYKTKVDYQGSTSVLYTNDVKVGDYEAGTKVPINKSELYKEKKASGSQKLLEDGKTVSQGWTITLNPEKNSTDSFTVTDIMTDINKDVDGDLHYTTKALLKEGFDALLKDGINYSFKCYDASGNEITDDTSHVVRFELNIKPETTWSGDAVNVEYKSLFSVESLNDGESISVKNTAIVGDVSHDATASYTKEKRLFKYIWAKDQYGGIGWRSGSWNVNFEETGGKLKYRIMVLPDKDEEFEVTDVIPEGLSLNVADVRVVLENRSNNWEHYEEGSYNINSEQYKPEISVNGQKLTVKIKSGFSQLINSGNSFVVEYTVSITDEFWNSLKNTEKKYTNIAAWNERTESQETTIKRHVPVLEKDGDQPLNENGEPLNEVKYYVIINAAGEKLNGGKPLTLVDNLNADGISVALQTENVKLYSYDPTNEKNHYKGQQLSTSAFQFRYDEPKKQFTAVVPDETPCVLEYVYEIENMNDKVSATFSNSVSLSGVDESTTSKNVVVKKATSSAWVKKSDKLQLVKVDADRYQITLKDAEFKLQKYENSNWTDVDSTYKTAENGTAIIDLTKLTRDYLYGVVETKAPDGYTQSDVKYYFVALAENKKADDWWNTHSYNMTQLGITRSDITFVAFSGFEELYIPNKASSLKVIKLWRNPDGSPAKGTKDVTVQLYQNTTKKEFYTVTVEFIGNNGDQDYGSLKYPVKRDTNFTLKMTGVHVTDNLFYVIYDGKVGKVDVNKNNGVGVFEYGTVSSDTTIQVKLGWPGIQGQCDPIYTPAEYVVDKSTPYGDPITLTSENGYVGRWTDLPSVDKNGAPVYYTVKEDSNLGGYTVSYLNNDGIQYGEITIINKKNEETITLPETGGTGTYWYTMGGVLLTAGAAFLIYKKHMQKGGKRIW